MKSETEKGLERLKREKEGRGTIVIRGGDKGKEQGGDSLAGLPCSSIYEDYDDKDAVGDNDAVGDVVAVGKDDATGD